MAKGVLGIIICPMLEDELIHFMCNDPEVQRIVLLENDYCGSIRVKLDKKGVKYDYIPQSEFDNGNVEFDRDIFNIVIKANNLALHSEPADLKRFIENQIVEIQPHIDALGLYYGLCGNFGWDATRWAKDNGYKPTAVFRSIDGKVCDDCVAVAVGGSDNYLKLEKKYTGMLYVIPAIANNWVDFMMAGDDAKSLKNLPEETKDALGIHTHDDFIRWMFEFAGYQYTLKMDTGLGDSEAFDKKYLEVTERVGLKPLVIEDGWVTIECARNIYAECKGYLLQ